MIRKPINVNNDDAQHEVFKAKYETTLRTMCTENDPALFSEGPILAVQWKDGGPWTYRVMEGPNGSDHKGQLPIIWEIKIDKFITQNTNHIYSHPITIEQYLCKQIMKAAG